MPNLTLAELGAEIEANARRALSEDIGSGDITAHAWIEVGGRTLVGGEDASRFTPLAAFGGTK